MNTVEMLSVEWWQVLLAGIATIAIFSFLYKENPFYRFFEHLFIGIATAITVMFTIKTTLWPQFFRPLLGFDRLILPDGSYAEAYNNLYLLWIIPILFGSLYYFILTKRLSWLAQLVIGFQLGIAGGLAFEATFNEMFPQIRDSFRTLYVPDNALASMSNLVFTVTLLLSLSYFFFTAKRRPGGAVERSAVAGRWLMMGCFGCFFGGTIMARMALLVERLDFLLNRWVSVIFG